MTRLHNFRAPLIASACMSAVVASNIALADIKIDYGSNLRYRYEHFDMDASPDASKASTLRLGLSAKATFSDSFGAVVDVEAIEQVFEDDYNIPTIPGQTLPGYPVIADPQGTELNQAYFTYTGAGSKVQGKLGRQEVMLNNGRFISFSGWRQNHQSFNGFTGSLTPTASFKVDYGYLTKLLRVSGEESSNGRTDLEAHFVNAAYTVKDVGIFKAYALLADFDTELTNSNDTFGVRYEGSITMGDLRFLSTLDYATQTDAGGNPNEIDADYYYLDAGLLASGIAYRVGYTVLEASSATNKFITPLAHPHNGWTELFLNNPSLGSSHGLEVAFVSAAGPVPGIEKLGFVTTVYDYSANTGSASYGKGLDFSLEYKPNTKATLGWRYGQYKADDLFSDSVRTSVYAAYVF